MTANRILELQKRFINNGKNPSKTWEDYLSIFMYLSVLELRNSPRMDTTELTEVLSMCGTCVILCCSDMMDAGIIEIDENRKIHLKENDDAVNS